MIVPFGCGTNFEGQPQIKFTASELASARSTLNPTQYIFNVKIHFINNNVALGNQELSALDMVGSLNYRYNVANIFFKYSGFDNITLQNNYAAIVGGTIDKRNMVGSYFLSTGAGYQTLDSNAINIYVCDRIESNTSVEGICWSYSISSTGQNTLRVIGIIPSKIPVLNNLSPSNTDSGKEVLSHEMGHFFSLYHTHQKWRLNSNNVLIAAADNSCGTFVENLDGSQATIYGDLLVDTNPDRVNNGVYSNCTVYQPGYINEATCTGPINFAQFNPPLTNIMAYYDFCRTLFSTSQFDRMRAFIANETQPSNFLASKLNTVLSLYQPYLAEPIVGNVASITDDGLPNGLFTVCRYVGGYNYFYQKGFNYTFNRFGSTTNNTINQTPNYLDYGTLLISQLSTTYQHNFGAACYRDVKVCQLEAISGGRIFTTNNLGSSILTQTTLTATELENPELINNLPSNTFNIIIKEITTGETKSDIIYKPN